MTEQEYKEQRARWISQALVINKKFFPRCFKARVRELAKLDASFFNEDYERIKSCLYEEFSC